MRILAGLVGLLTLVVAQAEDVTVDHAAFDRLLKSHVASDGRVDYASLKRNVRALDAYLETLDKVDPDKLSRNEQLALWINAYNAGTLRLIVEYYPIESIREIPEAVRWKARRWHIAGEVYALDEIENKQIRPVFKEPRIHFALNCAATGCPPLRREAYTGAKLERQLADQARRVHGDKRFVEVRGDKVRLTKLYEWYAEDFRGEADDVLPYVARYVPAVRQAIMATAERPEIEWIEYDWSLNEIPE